MSNCGCLIVLCGLKDFLAGGGKRQGDYTELQVGPAPTQMQNFPVPKQSTLQWTVRDVYYCPSVLP